MGIRKRGDKWLVTAESGRDEFGMRRRVCRTVDTEEEAKRVQRTILEECWKPSFARYLVPKYRGLRRELERYLELYNHDRAHNRRHTKGRIPAEVLGAAKMWR